VATLLSGAGWPALGAAAVNAIVSPWFVKKRPAALSTAYNGASIGGVIFSPLWVALIGWGGFPIAATIIGVGMVATVAVLAFSVLARTPESMGQSPDGETAAVVAAVAPGIGIPVMNLWRDPAFLTLTIGMALALFAQIGLIAHLVSLLVPALGTQGAGLAAGLSTAAAILGRTLVAQVEFARDNVARVVALMVATSQGVYAFAPAAFGLLREIAPETAVYVAAALVQLGAVRRTRDRAVRRGIGETSSSGPGVSDGTRPVAEIRLKCSPCATRPPAPRRRSEAYRRFG